MNPLIVGGLLVIGLAAIIGVILMAINEEPGTQTHMGPDTNTLTTTSIPAPRPAWENTIENSLPSQDADPTLKLNTVPKGVVLNGQLHELVEELQLLHLQARELEHRMSLLAEMANHIQRSEGANSASEH